MKKRATVSSIMTKNPISINKTHHPSDAIKIFEENNIHHLPVVSGDQLIGIISKTDIERISFVTGAQEGNVNTSVYDYLSIEQIMTKDVDSVEEFEEIRQVARKFSKNDYHALPVLKDGQLTGIVTTNDILDYFLEQY